MTLARPLSACLLVLYALVADPLKPSRLKLSRLAL